MTGEHARPGGAPRPHTSPMPMPVSLCPCVRARLSLGRFSEHEGKKVVRGRKWTATYFVYNKPLPHCAEPVTLNAEVSV